MSESFVIGGPSAIHALFWGTSEYDKYHKYLVVRVWLVDICWSALRGATRWPVKLPESRHLAKARCFLAGLSPSMSCARTVLFAIWKWMVSQRRLQNTSDWIAELFCSDDFILPQQVELIQQNCVLRLPWCSGTPLIGLHWCFSAVA